MAQNIMAATQALPGLLISQYVPNAESLLYTATASTSVKISNCTVRNNDMASSATISISLGKFGDSAGLANRICGFDLDPGDSATITELKDHFLGPGDFVSAMASANNKVSLVMSGVVFS